MKLPIRSLVAAALVVIAFSDGSHGAATENGRITLFGVSFRQTRGKYYSTQKYTYLKFSFKMPGVKGIPDSGGIMRIDVRARRLKRDKVQAEMEGSFLISTPLDFCTEKGRIEDATFSLQWLKGELQVAGKMTAVTAPCHQIADFRSERTTVSVEMSAHEDPKLLSYYNEYFFELFPELCRGGCMFSEGFHPVDYSRLTKRVEEQA